MRRRIATLGRAYYVSLLRPELFYADHYDFEQSMSVRQAEQLVNGSYARNFVEELGPRAAAAVLERFSRRYISTLIALRLLLAASLPVLVHVHGIGTAIALQSILYLGSRPLAWVNRRHGARCAETIARTWSGRVGIPHVQRTLSRHLSGIPANAIVSELWGKHIVDALPCEEDVREISLKLADQYAGSVADLIETSRALAR